MLDVLLVDDDELLRQSLQLLLSREGFSVTQADSGQAALAAAEREFFDLVLCDIRMPDMDGLETVARLRERLPEARLILMTGYASEDAPIQALRLKVDDYLRKPFNLTDFLERVRSLRRTRRGRTGPPPEQVLHGLVEPLKRHESWARHVQGVEDAVDRAASRLGLSAHRVRALRLAARLHDLVPPAEQNLLPEEEPAELAEEVAHLLLGLSSRPVPQDPGVQILTAAVARAHVTEVAGLSPQVCQEVERAFAEGAPGIAGSSGVAGDSGVLLPSLAEVAGTSQPAEPAGLFLSIQTLGPTRFLLKGQEVPPSSWESTRARWLFLYLLSRRGQWIPQDRLRDLFWPDSDPDRAQRALVSSVHRCRKALQNPEAVLRNERGYSFNRELPYRWDLEQLERAAREGRAAEAAGHPSQALAAYREAETLYRGDFAEECSEEWAVPLREAARRTAVETLERLAILLLETSPEHAEQRARRALELEPTSEAACVAWLRSLFAQSKRDEGVRGYHQFCQRLSRELDLGPGPELTRAFLELSGRG